MIVALSFYDVVLAVHIMAVVVGFGAMFAYPLVLGFGRRVDPRGLPLFHRMQQLIIRRLINPGLLVVVLAGIYLASERDAFAKLYVQWGFVAALVLGGLAGGYLAPREGKLAELADGEAGAPSAEYEALSRQVSAVSVLASLVVLATIFVMSAHLGA